MERGYTNFDKLLIFGFIISILYIVFSTNYYKIIIQLIIYTITYPYSILSVVFLLTFLYQFLPQIVKTNDMRFYALIYLMLITSILYPLYAALNANSRELVLEYISYLILSTTATPPLISLLSSLIPESNYRTPLRLMSLFIAAYISVFLLDIATIVKVRTINEFDVTKIGIYELQLILYFYQALIRPFFQTNLPQDIQNVLNNYSHPADYIAPIIIFSAFLYALKAIKHNKELFDKSFYYKAKNYEITEKNIIIKNLGLTVITSIVLVFITLLIIYWLSYAQDISYVLLIPILPLAFLIIALILGKEK